MRTSLNNNLVLFKAGTKLCISSNYFKLKKSIKLIHYCLKNYYLSKLPNQPKYFKPYKIKMDG